MVRKIDINCDMGESYGNFRVGNDEQVMPLITSACIACGFHAGDPVTMDKTVELAKKHRVAVGAHPGFPDLLGFGRREMKIAPHETRDYVLYQMGALNAFLEARAMKMEHVKLHGAFAEAVKRDRRLTEVVAEAILDFNRNLYWIMTVPSKSVDWVKSVGGKVSGEIYLDMEYYSDGSVVTRREQNMFEVDPSQISAKIIRFLDKGKIRTVDGKDLEAGSDSVSSIGVHGDTKNVIAMLKTIREELKRHNVKVTTLRNILG